MTALVVFHAAVGAGLLAIALHTWINQRVVPRLAPAAASGPAPPISVLVPARNEAEKIAGCVQAWKAQTYPNYELLVYDDTSDDDTAARAGAAAAGAAHVRIIRGGPLPQGWHGKPHACHRLRAQAHGTLLVFADADVTPAPQALAAAAALLPALAVDALSAVPRHVSPNVLVGTLVAVQNWAAAAFVPGWLTTGGRARTFAAVNGQFFVVRAAVYDAVGGFAAVRDAIGDDVALGRRLAAAGHRTPLLDGTLVLTCAPYKTAREVCAAHVRQLLPAFSGSATILSLAMAGLAALYLAPFGVLLFGAAGAAGAPWLWRWLPLLEICLGLLGRRLVDQRCGYSWWITLLHSLAVVGLLATAAGSVVRYRVRKVVEWRGRRYAAGPDAAASETR
jgi:Glycosyltransferase like family 2